MFVFFCIQHICAHLLHESDTSKGSATHCRFRCRIPRRWGCTGLCCPIGACPPPPPCPSSPGPRMKESSVWVPGLVEPASWWPRRSRDVSLAFWDVRVQTESEGPGGLDGIYDVLLYCCNSKISWSILWTCSLIQTFVHRSHTKNWFDSWKSDIIAVLEQQQTTVAQNVKAKQNLFLCKILTNMNHMSAIIWFNPIFHSLWGFFLYCGLQLRCYSPGILSCSLGYCIQYLLDNQNNHYCNMHYILSPTPIIS